MPWHGRNSVSVEGIQNNMIQSLDQVEIPEELSGKLRSVIHDCRLEDPQARPTADRLVLDYFSGEGIILLILFYRHECFTGKYTTRKIHKNYIQDPSGLFSIISHVSLLIM